MSEEWNLNAYCRGYHTGYDRPDEQTVQPSVAGLGQLSEYWEGYADGQRDVRNGVPKTVR